MTTTTKTFTLYKNLIQYLDNTTILSEILNGKTITIKRTNKPNYEVTIHD